MLNLFFNYKTDYSTHLVPSLMLGTKTLSWANNYKITWHTEPKPVPGLFAVRQEPFTLPWSIIFACPCSGSGYKRIHHSTGRCDCKKSFLSREPREARGRARDRRQRSDVRYP